VALRDAGVEVVVAANEGDVLFALARRKVDLLIGDAELLAEFTPAIRRQLFSPEDRGRMPLLLVVPQGTRADWGTGLEIAVDELLVRPVWSRELVTRVRLLLQRQLQAELVSTGAPPRAMVEGSLLDIGVGDILRSVELNQRSGTIRLEGADGIAGTVYFRDGRAVDAELGTVTGREAIAQLLSFRDGTFSVYWGPIDRSDVVGVTPQALVLDGARRQGALPTPVPVAIAREPGVERRGAVLSGIIQDNRGTGSTSLGWAPALVPPPSLGTAPAPASATTSRRAVGLRMAAIGGAVGSLLVALLFILLSSRSHAPDEPLPARASQSRPVVTVIASGAVSPPAAAPSDPLGEPPIRSLVHECRDAHALGGAQRTVEVCTGAFRLLPDSAPIASILARAELDQGHFELAGEWAQKAIDIDPTLPEPHAYLGFVADRAGLRLEARINYRRYLNLAPRGAYAQDITAILNR
jgi:hypothetical protein